MLHKLRLAHRLLLIYLLSFVAVVVLATCLLAGTTAAQPLPPGSCTDIFRITKPKTDKKAAKSLALKFCQDTFGPNATVEYKSLGQFWDGSFRCCAPLPD